MNTNSMPAARDDTVEHALALGRRQLANHADAYKEALLLLQHVSGKNKEHLIAHPELNLSDEHWHQFRQYLQRRNRGEPIAYITGLKEFWSLPLHVQPGVLIPRPETELLVETALSLIATTDAARVLDLGTGSGCIALAIASERPAASVIATDVSDLCIRTAIQSAATLNIKNVQFARSDWFESLNTTSFDIIVSNPPYISQDDPDLQQQVRTYEPESALIAAQNGLQDLKNIIRSARSFLDQNGTLLLEHGWRQGTAVRDYFTQCGYAQVTTKKDLQGHERITIGSYSHNESR